MLRGIIKARIEVYKRLEKGLSDDNIFKMEYKIKIKELETILSIAKEDAAANA